MADFDTLHQRADHLRQRLRQVRQIVARFRRRQVDEVGLGEPNRRIGDLLKQKVVRLVADERVSRPRGDGQRPVAGSRYRSRQRVQLPVQDLGPRQKRGTGSRVDRMPRTRTS